MAIRTVKIRFVALDDFTPASRSVASASKKVRLSLKRIQTQALSTSKSMKRAGNSVREAGGKMATFNSLVAGAALGGAVKSFADLEAGASNVLTLLGKTDDINRWRGSVTAAIQSAIDLGQGVDSASQGLFDMVSALGIGDATLGGSTSTLDAYHEAVKLAIAGNAEVADTTKGLTNVLRVYARDGLSAAEATEIMFVAQQKGRTTIAELASNLGKVTAVGRSMGVEFGEMAAVLSEMTIASDNTEMASTNLAAVISTLQKTTGASADKFRELGIPVGTVAVRQAGLAQTLRRLRDEYEKNGDVLSELIPNIRAMRGITGLTDESLQRISETMESYGIVTGGVTQLQAALAEQTDTLAFRMRAAWGAIQRIGVGIGREVAPFVEALTVKVQELRDWFEDLTPTGRRVVAALLVLGVAIPPIVIGVGLLISGIGAIIGAFALIPAGVFVAAAAIAAAAAAAALSGQMFDDAKVPILVFGGALALALGWPIAIGGAAIAIVVRYWDALTAFGGLKLPLLAVAGALGLIFGWPVALVAGAVGAVVLLWDEITALWEGAKELAAGIADFASDPIGFVFSDPEVPALPEVPPIEAAIEPRVPELPEFGVTAIFEAAGLPEVGPASIAFEAGKFEPPDVDFELPPPPPGVIGLMARIDEIALPELAIAVTAPDVRVPDVVVPDVSGPIVTVPGVTVEAPAIAPLVAPEAPQLQSVELTVRGPAAVPVVADLPTLQVEVAPIPPVVAEFGAVPAVPDIAVSVGVPAIDLGAPDVVPPPRVPTPAVSPVDLAARPVDVNLAGQLAGASSRAEARVLIEAAEGTRIIEQRVETDGVGSEVVIDGAEAGAGEI